MYYTLILYIYMYNAHLFFTSERRLLKWTKWRSGIILRFGNVVLLTVQEVNRKLFGSPCDQMAILRENDHWEKHSADTVVYGVDITVSHKYVCYNTS